MSKVDDLTGIRAVAAVVGFGGDGARALEDGGEGAVDGFVAEGEAAADEWDHAEPVGEIETMSVAPNTSPGRGFLRIGQCGCEVCIGVTLRDVLEHELIRCERIQQERGHLRVIERGIRARDERTQHSLEHQGPTRVLAIVAVPRFELLNQRVRDRLLPRASDDGL